MYKERGGARLSGAVIVSFVLSDRRAHSGFMQVEYIIDGVIRSRFVWGHANRLASLAWLQWGGAYLAFETIASLHRVVAFKPEGNAWRDRRLL